MDAEALLPGDDLDTAGFLVVFAPLEPAFAAAVPFAGAEASSGALAAGVFEEIFVERDFDASVFLAAAEDLVEVCFTELVCFFADALASDVADPGELFLASFLDVAVFADDLALDTDAEPFADV